MYFIQTLKYKYFQILHNSPKSLLITNSISPEKGQKNKVPLLNTRWRYYAKVAKIAGQRPHERSVDGALIFFFSILFSLFSIHFSGNLMTGNCEYPQFSSQCSTRSLSDSVSIERSISWLSVNGSAYG